MIYLAAPETIASASAVLKRIYRSGSGSGGFVHFLATFIHRKTTVSTDAVAAFISGALRYQVLRKDSEVHAGQLVRAWLDSPNPTAAQVRAGQRAKRKLFECNLRLVVARSRAFLSRARTFGAEHADLLQEGCLGLNRATELFDPARGRAFSTFAVPWIEQGIRKHLEGRAGVIRVPPARMALARRWRYRERGQTLEQFCKRWGYRPDEVGATLELLNRANCLSLDAQLQGGDGDSGALIDVLSDPRSEIDLTLLDQAMAVQRLREWAPDDVGLVELSLDLRQKDLAELLGAKRSTTGQVLQRARQRLAAVAGDQARELLEVAA